MDGGLLDEPSLRQGDREVGQESLRIVSFRSDRGVPDSVSNRYQILSRLLSAARRDPVHQGQATIRWLRRLRTLPQCCGDIPRQEVNDDLDSLKSNPAV